MSRRDWRNPTGPAPIPLPCADSPLQLPSRPGENPFRRFLPPHCARSRKRTTKHPMPDLLDANVWLALSVADHAHHELAQRYWHEESDDILVFCRTTAMALLRFLTNPKVVGDAALDGPSAWEALKSWHTHPRIRWVSEPDGLDSALDSLVVPVDPRGGRWTDCHLAAFAIAGGYRLVTLDRGFRAYPTLELLVLED